MAEALLVSEQHVDQDLLSSTQSTSARPDEPSHQRSGYYWLYTRVEQSPSYSFGPAVLKVDYQHYGYQSHWFSPSANPPKHRTSPSDARQALEKIRTLWRKRETERQVQEEIAWIGANRAQFAGRWVALLGGKLLAVGDSAREVFQATTQADPTPLIIRVDNETPQFAGW